MAFDDEPSDEHGRRAARTYAAAADHFNCASLAFWDRYGAATVSRLNLAPGLTVLDLCCGSGASAIPAAHTVGPAGSVIGIDVAAPLLEAARARAEREGLRNVEFRLADARVSGFPDGSFDAVVCVFGVFFVADMEAFVAEMWRLVRPGGTLAITTWGPGLWEPASSLFWETVREIEPPLFKAFNPWDEITT
ncbi:MAG TPA: methyltransferase domain-containing protein, partial [Solirubrobacter sp.]